MPIVDVQDAGEVERALGAILEAADGAERLRLARRLFVETLDFDEANQLVSLAAAGNGQLPADAHLVARRDGVTVAYIPLTGNAQDGAAPANAAANRVTAAAVLAAARILADTLNDQLLLAVSNRDGDQLHLISPDLTGSRPRLQRLVAYRGQPRRTVVQQIANLWQSYGVLGKTMGQAIAEAFSVEPVTKEFFDTYRSIFNYAKSAIDGFGDGEEETGHVFTQTLFNRLMFVYFLSRKGWLKFNGETDYLNALWRDYQANPDASDFYSVRLRNLFFFGLNNSQSRDLNFQDGYMASLIGQVPFLNGGLFEETELDKRDGITVPDAVIQRILTGLFDKFNFTVMESTPFDIEVAVDPEMLGKVFEELVTERHASGAYYTPRPVVSFMCREALKGYLEGKDTGASAPAIAALVDRHDTGGLGIAQARSISRALEEVTVVDPACGSGAYLLGMMQELIELQHTLYNVGVDARSIYDLKLDIIRRNLYGVDLDGFAVNIAMLRLWLSLAIDYEGDDPQPLPNLDFKVLCGDSLLGPDPSAGVEVQGTLGQDMEQFRRLGRLKGEYMRASDGNEKDRLRGEISQAEEAIREALNLAAIERVINWGVKFADVFAERQGFDIAIANPPYVRQENIGASKSTLARQYEGVVTARSDLYCYFYARALQLLVDGGMHVFVCSNSWLDVGYGAKLQEYLLNNAHIQAVYESAVERQFSTADINTMVSLVRKNSGNGESETRFVSLRGEFVEALGNPELRREIGRSRAELRAAGTNGNKFIGDKWGGKYLRAPDIYHAILRDYGDKLVRLGDVATVRFGIKTGANKFFFLTPEAIKEWGIEAKYRRPVMTSPQESRRIAVNPRRLRHQLFMCHEDREKLEDTKALAYIEWGEEAGYHQGRSVASRRRWYDLGEWTPTSIAFNYVIDTTARSYYFGDGCLVPNVFHTVRSKADLQLQLCTVLNSTFAQLIINLSGRANLGGGALKLELYELEGLTLPNPNLLSEPDTAIFDSANWDVMEPSPERRQIDEAVFEALGLTAGEREAVYEGVYELVGNRKRRAGSV